MDVPDHCMHVLGLRRRRMTQAKQVVSSHPNPWLSHCVVDLAKILPLKYMC